MNLRRKFGRTQIQLAGCFLISIAFVLYKTAALEGTEFSGGRLTGPLLMMTDAGEILFAVSFVTVFFFKRISAIVGLASSLLCLPLYLFFVAPTLFARIFGAHEFKVQMSGTMHWAPGAIMGIVVAAVTGYFSLRCLRTSSPGSRVEASF